jgi:hypothetical protein
MMSFGLGRPLASPGWRTLLAVATLTAGLSGQVKSQVRPRAASPEPSAELRMRMATPRRVGQVDSALSDYLRALSSDYDTSSAAVDAQWLMNPDLTRGPYALLQPRNAAGTFSHERVAAGDFMARLKLSASYVFSVPGMQGGPPFVDTLPAGVSQLWVDNSPRRGWRIVLVPEILGARPHVLPCRYYPGETVAAARIRVARPGGFDDTFCFPCNSGWCCAEM